MNNGIAIQSIVTGFVRIISPLKEKRRIRVTSKATIETGVMKCKNLSSNHVLPFRLMSHFLEKYPATRGSATYIVIERTSASQGTGIRPTPSRNPPSGPYKTSIESEFIATITRVCPSLPLARSEEHTSEL